MGEASCLIDLREVQRRTGLSRTTIWRRIRERIFPEPLYLSTQCRRWREDEIEAWVASLPTASAGRAAERAH